MPKLTAARQTNTIADRRTQRLLHSPTSRIFTPLLDSDNPVLPQPDRKLLPEPLYKRRSVLVQERHKRYRPFLCVTVGEGEGTCSDELAAECLVSTLGGLNSLALKGFQVFLHAGERGPAGALECRVERRQVADDMLHLPLDDPKSARQRLVDLFR